MNVKQWLIMAILFCALPLARGQDEKFKALFMYNFTKYLEWPAEKSSGEFIIAVFGNSPIINELNIIAQKKKVGNQKIVVKKVASISECGSSNILFIPSSKVVAPAEVNTKLAGKGIVVITEKEGLAKSFSGINYVKVNGKQSFEVNKKHIESQGIKLNSNLLSLGIRVE